MERGPGWLCFLLLTRHSHGVFSVFLEGLESQNSYVTCEKPHVPQVAEHCACRMEISFLPSPSLLPHQGSSPGMIIMYSCLTFASHLAQLARSPVLLARFAVLQASQNTVGVGPAVYR